MNAVREFAEVVRSQLNRLIHLREIDSEIFELTHDKWMERDELKQWKKQDIRRLQRYEQLQTSDALNLPLWDRRERTTTRVEVLFRVFDLSSHVIQSQQRAFEYCKEKPELAFLPAVIMQMAVVHRRWRGLFKIEQDDRETRQKWNEAFDELFDWIDEIESHEKANHPQRRKTSSLDELYEGAKEDVYEELLERLRESQGDDGPKAGLNWQHKGSLYEGMDPTAWKLCNFLWDRRAKTSYYDDEFAEVVFGDHSEFVDSVRVGSHRKKANKFFEVNRIPWRVKCPKEHVKMVPLNAR